MELKKEPRIVKSLQSSLYAIVIDNRICKKIQIFKHDDWNLTHCAPSFSACVYVPLNCAGGAFFCLLFVLNDH